MRKAMVTSTVAVLVGSCGPGEPDDEADPPGWLEYEDPSTRYYRLDRRVDVVALDPMLSRSGCGFLTDRAYDDLTETLAALDPKVDYSVQSGCPQTALPEDRFYIEGFAHGPFLCAWYCCHEDLIRAATVYFAVGSNLYGQEPIIDGEPYVALEPDVPCPE